MKFNLLVFLAIASLLNAVPLPSPGESNNTPLNHIYALLLAGSQGIENYRHQADVAHAYHVLITKGVPAKNIVVMMYDDIANNPHNPTPGQLRNSPNGPDYYKGLKIDYRGSDVNVDNFRAALKGQKNQVTVKGNSTGRVLESTTDDNIFLYYSDHGNVGILGMPDGQILTRSTFQFAIRKAQYKQMAVYIEACESGSMLVGMENDPRVFGLTASTASQSSFACNCKDICYGDEFSVAWMTDSESHNLNNLNLVNQFADVRTAVRRSTVVRFGNTGLNALPVSDFQGQGTTMEVLTPPKKEEGLETVPALDVPLYYYRKQAETADSEERRQEAKEKLKEILEKRKLASELIGSMVRLLEQKVAKDSTKDEGCFEKVVETFHEKCHPLGNSPFLTSLMRSFRPLSENHNCGELLRHLGEFCSATPFAKNKKEIFV